MMKNARIALLILLTSMMAAAPCLATRLDYSSKFVADKEPTGYSWLKMNDAERLDYVMTSLYILSSHGVEYKGSPKGYMGAIGEKLDKSPELYEANVTNILASVIYETEPQSRGGLERIRKSG